MAMKESSKTVFKFVKANDGKDMTLNVIATQLGLTTRQVNGSLVSFQRHKDADGNAAPLIERVETQIQDADGKYVDVKLIKLTDAGREFDPDAN